MVKILSHNILCNQMSGRDNNFKLLRMLGAMIIFLLHFFEISTGVMENQFYSLGYYALDFFFVASGFLITASIVRSRSILEFILARILRIFPAIAVVSVVVVLIVGAIATTLPAGEYYFQSALFSYFFVTSTTLSPHMQLPGVFENLVFPNEVNTPIWTLKYEVSFYFFTAILFVLGVFSSSRLLLFICGGILTAYFLSLFVPLSLFSSVLILHLRHFLIAYMLGTLAYIFADKVRLSGVYVVGGAILAFLLKSSTLGELSLLVWIAYCTLWMAYLKLPFLLQYNRLGDYSYGTYILHWPVICLLVTLMPQASLTVLLLSSLAIVIPLSVLSWHLIEKPMLGYLTPLSRAIRANWLFFIKIAKIGARA